MSNTPKVKRARPPRAPKVATLAFNVDEFTVGEFEDFEDAIGRRLPDVLRLWPVIDPDTGQPLLDADGDPVREQRRTMRETRGLIWVLLRRTDPDLTFEDTRKISIGEIDALLPSGTSSGSNAPDAPQQSARSTR